MTTLCRCGDILMALPSTRRQAWRFSDPRDEALPYEQRRRVWVLVQGSQRSPTEAIVRDVDALCDDEDAVAWVLRGKVPKAAEWDCPEVCTVIDGAGNFTEHREQTAVGPDAVMHMNDLVGANRMSWTRGGVTADDVLFVVEGKR